MHGDCMSLCWRLPLLLIVLDSTTLVAAGKGPQMVTVNVSADGVIEDLVMEDERQASDVAMARSDIGGKKSEEQLQGFERNATVTLHASEKNTTGPDQKASSEQLADSPNVVRTKGLENIEQISMFSLLQFKHMRDGTALWRKTAQGWPASVIWLLVIVGLCLLACCCAMGEMSFRKADRRSTAAASSPEVWESNNVRDVMHRGQASRGRVTGKYQVGDLTHGLVQAGKDSRGDGDANYKFGDFTRGMKASMTTKK